MNVAQPADLEVERQYLAACLHAETLLDLRGVEPSEMALPYHGALLGVMRDLRERGEPVDVMSVRGGLQRIGAHVDADVMLAISNAIPPIHPRSMAPRLRELAQARRLRVRAGELSYLLEQGDVPSALKLARELADERDPSADNAAFSTMRALVASGVQAVKAARDREGPAVVATGIADLDEPIGGMEYGDLVVIGGDSSVGKSSVALLMLMHEASIGHRCGYVSVEDPKARVERRLVSMVTGIPARLLRDPSKMGVTQWEHLEGAVHKVTVGKSDIHVAFAVSEKDHVVADRVRTLIRDHGCEVVVLDYVQAVEVDGIAERRDQIRKVLISFKRELNAGPRGVVGIVLSQFRKREDERVKPKRSDLYEANVLAQMAEMILLFWKDKDGVLNGVLDKAKDDATGTMFVVERDRQTGQLVRHRDGSPTPPKEPKKPAQRSLPDPSRDEFGA